VFGVEQQPIERGAGTKLGASRVGERDPRSSKRKGPARERGAFATAAYTESTADVYKENCGKRTESAQPTGASVDNPVAIRSAAGFGLSRAAFE